MKKYLAPIVIFFSIIFMVNIQTVSAATAGITMNPNTEIYFQDNGQIRSLDNNHRILFRRSEDKMELREFGDILFSSGSTGGQQTSKMVVKANGYVGINTANPQATFHINGNSGLMNIEGVDHAYIQWYPRGINAGRKGYLGYATPENNSFYIENNGNIVLSPDGGMVMTNATIKASQVIVTNSGPWADYVFDKDYKLLSLDEVESYINNYSHLPGIESSEYIKNNNLSLGDMQTKQMAKIEELTLYAINADKEIKSLKDENNKLKNQVSEFQRQLDELRNLIK